MKVDICPYCNKQIALLDGACQDCFAKKSYTVAEEFKKCKESPYYFATNYIKVNGKPFTTNLSEEVFNGIFDNGIKIVKSRKGTVIVKR